MMEAQVILSRAAVSHIRTSWRDALGRILPQIYLGGQEQAACTRVHSMVSPLYYLSIQSLKRVLKLRV